MQFVLGADIGTTNIKAIVVGLDGWVRGQGHMELREVVSEPQSSEHNLEELWQAFLHVCRGAIESSDIDSSAIVGIGLTCYLGGLSALDVNGKKMLPGLLTWKDHRVDAFFPPLANGVSEGSVGAPIDECMKPSQSIRQFWWLQRHLDIGPNDIGKLILSPKQYITYRLVGAHHLDWECARAIGLFDLTSCSLRRDACSRWGLTPSMLPELHKCHEVVGYLSPESARLAGLVPGTPVVAGGGDGLMSSIGCGVVRPGLIAASVGTVATVRAFRKELVLTKSPWVDCKILPDVGYLNSSVLSSGGRSLKWYRDEMSIAEKVTAEELGMSAFELIEREAQLSSPGCNGLIFVPVLPGSRGAFGRNSCAGQPIGGFFGIGERHSRRDLARAIMEGVAFGMKMGVSALEIEGHGDFSEVRFGGGGSCSALWRQILADTLRMPVVVLQTPETGALGAAITAAWGIEAYPSLEVAVSSMVHNVSRHEPDTSRAALYEELGKQRNRVIDGLCRA